MKFLDSLAVFDADCELCDEAIQEHSLILMPHGRFNAIDVCFWLASANLDDMALKRLRFLSWVLRFDNESEFPTSRDL